MKKKLVYGTILTLVICAAWLFRNTHAPVGGRESPRAVSSKQSQYMPPLPPPPQTDDEVSEILARYPPPPNGYPTPDGTPPSYLAWEQMLNPVRGPGRNRTREEVGAKLKRGVKAKFNLRVLDSMRTPVPDVDVDVQFIAWENNTSHQATSDGDGLCSFEGVTMAYVLIKATKDGYYTTKYQHYFDVAMAPYNCVKDGRWQPWDATLELVLKEKRNPAALYVKYRRGIVLPKKGVPYGFDFAVGDLVEPDGRGKVADLIFTYTAENRSIQECNRELRVQTVNGGGLIRDKRDKWSELQSSYTAPEAGYEPEIVFRLIQIPGKIVEDSKLKLTEYLLFETYSRGEQPCVGKIYGEMLFGETYQNPDGGSTGFLYFFNPVPGDRRIESDPDRNLFGRSSANIERLP
ncbi:MAG: hypothetical protein FWH21_06560 [Kiritimatiellaeota bacterium]|nr:hypothetical protein [Kiritimatiellota bacterium]